VTDCITCTQKFLSKHYDRLQDMCCMYVGEELGQDLMHDLCVTILEDNGEKYEDICNRGELWYYLIRVAKINAFSKTTRFYYKYKKHKERETNDLDFHVLLIPNKTNDQRTDAWTSQHMPNVDAVLGTLPFFEREIFRVYYLHEHTLNTLSHATGINRNTIHKALRRARRKIDKYNQAQSQAQGSSSKEVSAQEEAK